MIITENEKNRILELYGLNNKNNFLLEQRTISLYSNTKLNVSGSGSNWIITYKASDNNHYPISTVLKDKKYTRYTKTFTSRRQAEQEIVNLKTELSNSNKKNSKPQIPGLARTDSDETRGVDTSGLAPTDSDETRGVDTSGVV